MCAVLTFFFFYGFGVLVKLNLLHMEQGDETMARMTSARQGSVQQHRSMTQVTTNQPNVQPAPTAVVTEANLPLLVGRRENPMLMVIEKCPKFGITLT
ncbi:hypothetical protein QL285_003798 [Trifolium repens]|nr:hypothetical protein QL285_003798 [Trifolium repens]